jgi:hypothetical protein
MVITTVGLNTPESKYPYLGKLIVFHVLKNKMPFPPLQNICEESYTEKYPK